MKKIFILIVFLILGVLAGYLFLHQQWSPYGKGGIVYIPKGDSLGQIAQRLSEAEIIRNPWSFKVLVKLKGVSRNLQAGEYEFKPNISSEAIIAKLIRGERLVHRFTIPEGYNFQQIAKVLAGTGIASEAQILQAFRDPKYLGSLGFPSPSLEGYLFPSTYEYNRGTTLDEVLSMMIGSFKKQFTPEMKARMESMGWTLPQVTTLASIIEKETSQPEERALIASVFHNRLRQGMLLQSDPTIIYGLEDYRGDIRRKDIRNPHRYNTYVHPGLPPGPIASPGRESLEAVLFPADSEYLYFVSKGNGFHHFSKTLAEHNAAVQKYQLNP
ncbi:MAG: endolytic transglycosylase MltG [bacterium]|nr:endolytic transglycosylase MltG [bacterium]